VYNPATRSVFAQVPDASTFVKELADLPETARLFFVSYMAFSIIVELYFNINLSLRPIIINALQLVQ